MAQKTLVTKVSDLDGSEASETVRFALDGTEYEIDLTPRQAQEMRESLAQFTGRARKKRAKDRKPSRGDLPEIREYAKARGYDIRNHGRVPGRVPGRITAEYDRLTSDSRAEG
jgi:hypothetical protein